MMEMLQIEIQSLCNFSFLKIVKEDSQGWGTQKGCPT
jgi:hypothetical protein